MLFTSTIAVHAKVTASEALSTATLCCFDLPASEGAASFAPWIDGSAANDEGVIAAYELSTAAIAEDSIACLIYTSGTTGTPKGNVVHLRRCVLSICGGSIVVALRGMIRVRQCIRQWVV